MAGADLLQGGPRRSRYLLRPTSIQTASFAIHKRTEMRFICHIILYYILCAIAGLFVGLILYWY